MSVIKQRFGITENELKNLTKVYIDLIGDSLEFRNETTDSLEKFTTKLIMKLIDFHGKNWAQGLIGYMKSLRNSNPPMTTDQRKCASRTKVTIALLNYDLQQIDKSVNDYVKYYTNE